MYMYDWSVISRNMDVFIYGALKTLEISAISILLAIPIGIIFGMGRISKNKLFRLISSICRDYPWCSTACITYLDFLRPRAILEAWLLLGVNLGTSHICWGIHC